MADHWWGAGLLAAGTDMAEVTGVENAGLFVIAARTAAAYCCLLLAWRIADVLLSAEKQSKR